MRAMKFLTINGAFSLMLCATIVPDVLVHGSPQSSYLVLDQEQPSKKCGYSKWHSLLQVDCSNRGLDKIPQKLNSNIQAMYMASNRLRDLPSDSFAPYKSLAYLYLDDNFIGEIDESMEYPEYLQVLDLSKNGLHDVPSSVFDLPSLKKIYLSKNKLKDGTFDINVTSPIELIDLAENSLTKIPSVGLQPSLLYLNVSYNKISHVTTEDLAQFCSLQTLDLTNNPLAFDPTNCECYHFASWISERKIKLMPGVPCNNDTFEACGKLGFSNETTTSFERCLDVIKVRAAQLKARSTWITVVSCISAFLVCLVVGLYCVHKRNKKRSKKLKTQQKLTASNANTELLNGNLPETPP
ncbi:decorin isoform X2 [Athalia rosae]|uniref:decorin isoform X2 n=1 Tax=Athalia rosae TaxID=37344 RepID=UPI00203359B1|nr:decorin isoform X2 [Athalia rosae]